MRSTASRSCSFKGDLTADPPVSVVPAGYLGTDAKAPLLPYDLAKAKALLKEAGFPNGVTVKTIQTTLPSMLTRRRSCRRSSSRPASTWSSSSVDHPTFHAKIRKDLSGAIYYTAARFPVADVYLTQFFHSRSIVGTPTAVTNFSHCDVADKEIDAARTEPDPAKQKELWETAQKKIIEEVCAVPLFEQLQVWAHKTNVDFGYELADAIHLGPLITEATHQEEVRQRSGRGRGGSLHAALHRQAAAARAADAVGGADAGLRAGAGRAGRPGHRHPRRPGEPGGARRAAPAARPRQADPRPVRRLPGPDRARRSRPLAGDQPADHRRRAAVLPYTIELTLASLLIGIVIGVPLGVVAAQQRNGFVDWLARIVSLAGLSFPAFVSGILLLLAFAVELRWFPVISTAPARDPLRARCAALALPAINLGLIMAAYVTRVTRSGMLEALSEDYVRTARAKGVPARIVVWRHALRNALIPIVTVVGLYLGMLIGNSVLTEIVFNRPGLGKLIVGALNQRDYSMLQGLMVVYALDRRRQPPDRPDLRARRSAGEGRMSAVASVAAAAPWPRARLEAGDAAPAASSIGLVLVVAMVADRDLRAVDRALRSRTTRTS